VISTEEEGYSLRKEALEEEVSMKALSEEEGGKRGGRSRQASLSEVSPIPGDLCSISHSGGRRRLSAGGLWKGLCLLPPPLTWEEERGGLERA